MNLSMTVAEIASMLNGKVIGSGETVIRGLAKIEEAKPDTLSFLANVKYSKYLETTQAGAVLVSPGVKDHLCTVIEVENPYLGFLKLLQKFYPQTCEISTGVHSSAFVHDTARISESAKIGAFCYVGPNSTIGDNTILFPHVVVLADSSIGKNCEIHSRVSIREGTVIGDGVIIQDGAVIGSDGFGFAPSSAGYQKVPQVGRVVIADGVEIGANTTIDRATMGETVIGKGTKLDNLIQVAHNVVIGSDTVIAAQTGVSGSAKIGSNCMIGGQVGFVGHIQVEDGVMIGAQSGVGHDLKKGEIVSGSPARPHSLWKRIEASVGRLPDLLKRVRKLESAVFGETSKHDEAAH